MELIGVAGSRFLFKVAVEEAFEKAVAEIAVCTECCGKLVTVRDAGPD